ncbi:uncharacterized protein LOC134219083 [Armigeres subalbatus]|uniref:uncharacterized protein LOC134219083 n=1 Tax=Armigeres subalbatus TaxID=124917 RepID=UPI002ED1C8C4
MKLSPRISTPKQTERNNLGRIVGRMGSSSLIQKKKPGGIGLSSARANAFNHQFDRSGFGSSSAHAGAQSFSSRGPLGGFGVSSANSATQTFRMGPRGLTGSSQYSGSQSYKLGNRHLNIALSRGLSMANGKPSISHGSSISFS